MSAGAGGGEGRVLAVKGYALAARSLSMALTIESTVEELTPSSARTAYFDIPASRAAATARRRRSCISSARAMSACESRNSALTAAKGSSFVSMGVSYTPQCRHTQLRTHTHGCNVLVMEAIRTPAAETRCLRCHRVLKSARSVVAMLGRGCAAKIRQAARETALEGLNEKQRDKALEIVADGGAVPSNREGVWHVTSGDGSQAYLTTGDGHCTCKWGLRRVSAETKVCAHVGAVRLVALRPSRRSMTKAA